MAGLFRFRRKDQRSATSAGPSDPTATPSTHPDGGGPTTEGALERVGQPDAPASAPGTSQPSADSTEPPPAGIGEGMSEIIRPAAIVPEHAARRVLVELARRDLTNGGEWQSEPQLWSRYDAPVGQPDEAGPELMGTIHVTYGTPTKYEITLYRVTVTSAGVRDGWTVASLTDEALGFGGLTLAECPRATVNAPPRPFTY